MQTQAEDIGKRQQTHDSENHRVALFSDREKPIPDGEIAFPNREFAFPGGEKQIPDQQAFVMVSNRRPSDEPLR